MPRSKSRRRRRRPAPLLITFNGQPLEFRPNLPDGLDLGAVADTDDVQTRLEILDALCVNKSIHELYALLVDASPGQVRKLGHRLAVHYR